MGTDADDDNGRLIRVAEASLVVENLEVKSLEVETVSMTALLLRRVARGSGALGSAVMASVPGKARWQ